MAPYRSVAARRIVAGAGLCLLLTAAAGSGLAAQGLAAVGSLAAADRRPAADPASNGGPAVAVRAAPEAPAIDGDLSDSAWQAAPVHAGFTQRDPDEGAPGSERTEFRVVYTASALFVAIRAYDAEPARITAMLARRDDRTASDEVVVMIDSYRDRRTGYLFGVNAAGVQRDEYLYDDNRSDDRWDAVWDAATRIDDQGWVAELRIPLSQLRFAGAEISTLGFNVSRTIARRNEEQFWRRAPKGASGVVSLFGELTGIGGIAPPRRLELQPYSVARLARSPADGADPFDRGTSAGATIGADVRYGVTSALTLTATVNPDFGQVEADPAEVNLSAFESFLPERRPFFTEGLDLFQFPVTAGQRWGGAEGLFYSRRIGRSPQGSADARGGSAQQLAQTTILGAAKLTGKTAGGWTVGVLAALTDDERAAVIDSAGERHADVVEPLSGYAVVRVARDLRGGRTVLGAFGTTAQRRLPDRLHALHSAAYSGGLDLVHRFADDTYRLEARVLGSQVLGSAAAIERTQRASARYFQRPELAGTRYDPARTSLSGYAFAVSAAKEAGVWRWSAGMERRSPGLELNDVGFLREADRTSQWATLSRHWFNPGPVFRSLRLSATQRSRWTHAWERRDLSGELDAWFTLRNYWRGWLGVEHDRGGVSPASLRGGPAIDRPGQTAVMMRLGTDDRKAVRLGVSGRVTTEHETAGSRVRVGADVSWRPALGVELSAEPEISWNRDPWQYVGTSTYQEQPQYLLGDLEQRTVSMELRGSITFSPTLTLQAYAEPFISTGRYRGFSRVVAPRAGRFADQLESVAATAAADGQLGIDLDRDGAGDLTLGAPDFTVVSLRSNLVLRWEYGLGSTLFLVWQQGRSDRLDRSRFDLGANVGDLFSAPSRHVFLVKINYWIDP